MAQSLTTLQSTALGPVLTASGVAPTVALANIAPPGIQTAVNTAGGETVTVTGTGFNSGVIVYINSANTVSCTTTYGNSTSLTFVTPALSAGTYNVMLYNTDGTNGLKPAGIIFSTPPVWVTSAGALAGASLNNAYSQSVSATGTGITYSVTSGSLPTGLSLNSSSGAITGTPTVANTFNFTITAYNSYNQGTARAFSILVTSGPATVDYLVVAGGAGGGYYGAGGGAGGLLYATGASFTAGITYTITVGNGGAGTPGPAGGNGGNSSISGSGFTTVTAIGGGGGGGWSGGLSGNGGSGGGASSWDNVKGKGVYPGSTYLSQARQGYDGGSYDGTGGGNSYMGNGGGANAQGANGAPGNKGGDGLQYSITGTATYYAGGGGGGGYVGDQAGGAGGGGKGGAYTFAGSNGTVNTGGGGGGGSYGSGQYKAGGSGGSGVVILRTLATAVATAGSPTVTTDGSYNVYKFTGTGTITF